MPKVSGTPTEYGSSIFPPKRSRLCSTLHSPLAAFIVGVLIGVTIAYAIMHFESLIGWYRMDFVCALNSNFTNGDEVKHTELKDGILQFLQLIGEIDESVSVYSEDIIQQLDYDIQRGIANLEELQKSTKPKVRRRPPVERWNSTT